MQVTSPPLLPQPRSEDQRVFMRVTWDEYETICAIRGERSGVRLTYLDGVLELMSPSNDHERLKTLIARLVEAYAEERDLPLDGYGSWTIKRRDTRRGVEPDECYVLGRPPGDRPDLAIEVVWTSGGLDKLEVYAGLGVREVWMWRDGRIEVWALVGDAYEARERSGLMPGLDLSALVTFLDVPGQTQAVKAWRAWLREHA